MSGAEPVHLDTLPDSRAINAAKEELFNGIESRIERRRAEQRWRIGRQSIEHVRENRQTLHLLRRFRRSVSPISLACWRSRVATCSTWIAHCGASP